MNYDVVVTLSDTASHLLQITRFCTGSGALVFVSFTFTMSCIVPAELLLRDGGRGINHIWPTSGIVTSKMGFLISKRRINSDIWVGLMSEIVLSTINPDP